jgi:hypothetical protein
MRALSARQAATCEMSKTPRCKCRCQGALHGARRRNGALVAVPADQSLFDWLRARPESDPHRAAPRKDPPSALVQAALATE